MLYRFAVFALLTVVAASTAHAQTYTLANHSNLMFGNYALTISNCTYQLNNGSAGSCASDNVDFTATEHRGILTISFSNAANSSSAILSQASAAGCTCVTYDLSITNSATVSAATVADTGVNTGGATIDNWMQFTSVSGSPRIDALISRNETSAGEPESLPANTTSISITSGLGLNSAYQAGVLSLNTASLKFTSTPEPASLSLLLSACSGLALARRRSRR